MRHKKIIWSVMIWICFGLTVLHAQNTMFVTEKSGTQTLFTFTSINKLTFATGNMSVNKTDGSTKAYSLANLSYLNFGNVITIDEICKEENNSLLLYPNPVLEQLFIQYSALAAEKGQLQIIDIQDRIIFQQNFNSQIGINYVTIPVSKLLQGMYLLSLQYGKNFKTSRFIKN